MTALEDRIRELLMAGRKTGPVRRSCDLCGADLSEPGTAAPILDPDAREGPAPEWQCLDERGCDLRCATKLRGFPGPLGYVLDRVADINVPARLELLP